MRIRMKHKITFKQADVLVEKYYDGLTSVEEENRLRDFLSQPGLPEKYEAEQAIFGYFKPQLEKKRFGLLTAWGSTGVAATVLLAVFGLQFFAAEVHASYAYVDGHKITDPKEIRVQAIASLKNLSSGKEDVEKSLDNVKTKNIIRQQLDVFSDFE